MKELITVAGDFLELLGVAAITLGAIYATIVAGVLIARNVSRQEIFERYRQRLGKGILLGLEFLVAGDIIRTVAIEPTFRSLGVLGAIVLIRTFLSFTLEVETTGRWPWQQGRRENGWHPS